MKLPKPKLPKLPKLKRRRRGLLLGAVAVLAILYGVGVVLTGSRMPAGATIAGVDVGGMSSSGAKAKLTKVLTPRSAAPIRFVHDGKNLEIQAEESGLKLDLDRSVAVAGGKRTFNPIAMIRRLFGEPHYPARFDVDDTAFDGVLDVLGTSVNIDVVEAQITFAKTKPVARQPKAGLVVDRDETLAAVKAQWLESKQPIEVPTIVVQPAVDAARLDRAMAEIAKPAISGPIALRVGKKDVDLLPSAYAPALTIGVIGDALVPTIDAKKLAKPLTDSTTGFGAKAIDATFRVEGSNVSVVPSKVGLGLQPEEMATRLIPVLTKTGAERSLTIEAKPVEPEFTTGDAKKLGIKQQVGTFTTYYAPAAYRDINQGRAAALIDGTIVKPGETFSFNTTVGERTRANGFVVGTVINGGVFREEQGGGVSQVVTTTYNAAFFAGMTDIEHHPHDLYISRYPVGREATVYWGALDLRFRNDTKYGVLIKANVLRSAGRAQGATTVSLFSTKVWEIKAGLSTRRNIRQPTVKYDPTSRCVPQSPSVGFDVDVYRYFFQNGRKVKTETDTAHYRATDDVRCREAPKPKSD